MYTQKTFQQLVKLQLDGIPDLIEVFNRLPSSTKKWVIEGVIQATKEFLTQKGEEIDRKYEESQTESLTQMLTGQKYLIRELLGDIEK